MSPNSNIRGAILDFSPLQAIGTLHTEAYMNII